MCPACFTSLAVAAAGASAAGSLAIFTLRGWRKGQSQPKSTEK